MKPKLLETNKNDKPAMLVSLGYGGTYLMTATVGHPGEVK